jgi:hypothetical protein
MHLTKIARSLFVSLGIMLVSGSSPVAAQWLNYPTPGTPLTRAGKPNLSAKTPRAQNGKPDLSGLWMMEPPAQGEIERLYGSDVVLGDDPRTFSKYFVDLLIDFKDEPLTAEGAALTAKNRENIIDAPTARCLPLGLPDRYFIPYPQKIFQTSDAIAIFYEVDGAFREIHTDGRQLPEDPFPSFMGYSTGRWEGDTLVVDTAGFNDKTWLDVSGHPRSEALHVRERFHRRDYGHMDIEATVQDPRILTMPVTLRFTELLVPNSDVLEFFCTEGERDQGFLHTASK